MKNTFTKAELIAARGCYDEEKIERLWNGGRGETVTLVEILETDIPIKDKTWFFRNKTEMTIDQKKAWALIAAWIVLPILEERRPDDKRPREALEATEKFKKGEISREQLRDAADAAAAAASDAAYDAADAAYYAAYAAAAYAAAAYDAAYDAAAYDAAASDAAASDAAASASAYAAAASASAYAAYNAASAAYAEKKTTYSQRLQIAMVEFVKAAEIVNV